MDYKIKAPNKSYNGESAGVHFVNGEGIAKNGKSIEWLREKGYTVEAIEVAKTSNDQKPNDKKLKGKKGTSDEEGTLDEKGTPDKKGTSDEKGTPDKKGTLDEKGAPEGSEVK